MPDMNASVSWLLPGRVEICSPDSPRVRVMVVTWPLSFPSSRHIPVSPAVVGMGNGGRYSSSASLFPSGSLSNRQVSRGISSSTGLFPSGSHYISIIPWESHSSHRIISQKRIFHPQRCRVSLGIRCVPVSSSAICPFFFWVVLKLPALTLVQHVFSFESKPYTWLFPQSSVLS